jgi:hypothetical protein
VEGSKGEVVSCVVGWGGKTKDDSVNCVNLDLGCKLLYRMIEWLDMSV